jgi:glycosyltransferase involved in cell wall biosynthesis
MSRISVIIPTRNRASQLISAVESAQKAGEDVEVVVVDDASTDDTARVCADLGNIKYVRLEENVRQAAARNAGIAVSSGQFISFLDDDDLRLPRSLDKQIEVLSAFPEAAFIYGQVMLREPNGTGVIKGIHPATCWTGDIFWQLLAGNFIHIPSVVLSRRRFEEIGGFDPLLTGVEDWDLWLRLSERYAVLAMDEPVAIYKTFTKTSGQTSSNIKAMYQVGLKAQAKGLCLARALAGSAAKRKEVRETLIRSICNRYLFETQEALASGNKKQFVASLMMAMRIDFTAASSWSFSKVVTRLSRYRIFSIKPRS